MVVALLALRDLIRQIATTYAAAPRLKRTIIVMVVVMVWLVQGLVVGPMLAHPRAKGTVLLTLLSLIFVWPPLMIAYAWTTAPSADEARLPIKHSRIALLYHKFFGLNGKYFALKVQVSQMMSVVLQAWTKLPLLGAFVSVHPRLGPVSDIGYVEYYDKGGSPSAPIFWTILAALIVNAIYPMVLLVQRDAFWNRRAVAVVDGMLDLIFGQVFFFTMLLNGMFSAALPTTPIAMLSLFYPTIHVVFCACAIEEAAADLKARKRRRESATARKRGESSFSRSESMVSSRTSMAVTGRVRKTDALPLWKGLRFGAVALGAVAVALFALCHDRYPLLAAIPGPCAPCICNDARVLTGCPYHAELKESFLWIGERGVTAVEKGAFKGNEGAGFIHLYGNELETLPAGVFDDLQSPFSIVLDHNRLTELPPDLFNKLGSLLLLSLDYNRLTEVPPGLFDNLGSLLALFLNHNNITVLTPGLFDDLQSMFTLILNNNNITNLSPGLFDELGGSLQFLFLGHNNVAELPAGVFDRLKHLEGLALNDNRIDTLPPEIFRGLKRAVAIDISSNNISRIDAGTFAVRTNPNLAYVSLAHNAIRSAELEGSFSNALEHLWLTGSNLTCAELAGAEGLLPRGADCTQEVACGGMWGVAPLGNGICDAVFDSQYDTQECLWDAGDCEDTHRT